MKISDIIKTYAGLVILAGAMLFAVIRVVYNQFTYEAPDVTTIKICHWQLESGFREALQRLIDAYEKQYFARTGKRVRIVQMPISERGYTQFLNTSLIGGTAPDIIEKGFSTMATDPSYVARFFRPLGRYVNEPNPYNKGTKLDGIPWRETFFDGMQSAYDRVLLDYYYIPFSMFTVRIYYNRDLYREMTGRDKPPKTYTEFIEACREIKQAAARRNVPVVPIAGSKYQGNIFAWRYQTPFLYDISRKADTDFSGYADKQEVWAAYQRNIWHFHTPRIIASYKCMTQIAENFQKGWMAALRDDAVFMFVQKRAVMFASGSWDASSLIAQVGDKFEIGIFDFPLPINHPVYGKYIKGSISEGSIGGGIPWAITQQSRHTDLCVDFLRFCTTRANNEQFNLSITWLPVVRGAHLSERLLPFRPKIKGLSSGFDMGISTEVQLVLKGGLWPLFAGQTTPDKFTREMDEVYQRTGAEGYQEEQEKLRRNLRNLQRVAAAVLFADYANADTSSVSNALPAKYVQLMISTGNFGYGLARHNAEFKQLEEKRTHSE